MLETTNTLIEPNQDFRVAPANTIKIPTQQNDLISLFLKHAASSPDSLAIMSADSSFTYQQLFVDVARWKALFSQHLQDRVVVYLDRTPRLLSILLALQWLEITYIPVDLSIPIERLRVIIEDSQAYAILYDTAHHLDYSSLPCLKMDLASVERPPLPEDEIIDTYHMPNQDSLAYIIYTSGSTGTPKGVAISRGALNNFLASMSGYFLRQEHELLLAITTIAFDIAALELYLPLWQQKSIFLANSQQHKDPHSISKLLNDYPITLLQATPAMWSMLVGMEWENKATLIALCGGESLSHTLAQRLLTNVTELWNMYGPTEATVWCSLKQIQPNEPITIGRPIHNMEMVVLDEELRLLPPNVKGELFIGGLGLAVGYVNNEELTRSRFIHYPQALGGRLYRVGDVASVTSNGEFILFGRTDNQIKLHGYRIELEDIESQIQAIAGIRECAVIVNNEQLIAFICLITPASLSEHELLDHLAAHLPEYMLPTRLIFLERLPLTSSGKINRKALPDLAVVKTTEAPIATELTPLQSLVSQIWAEEFKLPIVGINDNFFELGGHSLLAERILFKLEQQIEKQLSLSDFYRAPTIVQFVKIVEQVQREQRKKTTELSLSQDRWSPLNDFQFMFWMSAIFEPSLKTLRVADRKRIQGPLNKEALTAALDFVYQKHEGFSYRLNHFYPAQKRQKKSSIQWVETSLVDKTERVSENLLNASFDELNYPPGQFLDAPTIIAKLFYLQKNQIEIQISMSHFICDITAMEIFFEDLSNAYLHYAHQLPLNTKPLLHSPISYALHQKNMFHQYEPVDAVFWKQYLQDAHLFSFPNKYILKETTKQSQFSTYIEIPELTLKKLHELCSSHHVTISDALCAAIGLSLKICCPRRIKSIRHLVVNKVKSTRGDPSYDNVIGCFLNIQPIKLDLNSSNSLMILAKQAQRSSLETAEHQRAASLIKLASIGQVTHRGGFFKQALISGAINIFSKISRWLNISPTVLEACKILSRVDRQVDFFINVNIWNNFVARQPKSRLFDKPCKNIPLHTYNLSMVQHVFDINFLRYDVTGKAYVVVSSNLTPAFRQHFGTTLLKVLKAN